MKVLQELVLLGLGEAREQIGIHVWAGDRLERLGISDQDLYAKQFLLELTNGSCCSSPSYGSMTHLRRLCTVKARYVIAKRVQHVVMNMYVCVCNKRTRETVYCWLGSRYTKDDI